jgi:copper chaperone
MKRFKTNIKCGGCIQKIKPYLDDLKEIKSWTVDLDSPDRTLSVEGEVTEEKIIRAIHASGYQAEKLD